MAAGNAIGAPPLNPTGPPLYSFDANSPKVLNGRVGATDLLIPGLEGDVPTVVLSGANLGLGDAADDLDGLSAPNSSIGPDDEFAILFSIDRSSLGGVEPDAVVAGLGLPYNAQDQAAKGQAAGDQFMSLTRFTGNGGAIPLNAGRAVANNTLLRNNFDEGGVDFSADPPVSAEDTATRVAQDNVGGLSGTVSGDGVVGPLFFTATSSSPSLALLPGLVPSGANIYFNPNPSMGPSQTRLFASAGDLGLVPNDDLSAVLVFDRDGDGLFGGSDQVLFSLAPGSQSLPDLIPGLFASPGDVFSVTATGAVSVFATAADLGLDPAVDHIDALDVLTCTAVDSCEPVDRAIRAPQVPTLSAWGLITMLLLLLTVGSVIFLRRRAQLS